jgi:hypothetical protein
MPEHDVRRWYHRYDWDAVAGILAAMAALFLHLFHILQADILLTMMLVLVTLLLLRQLRHEEREERVERATIRTEQTLAAMQDLLAPTEVVLVGPRHLRMASEAFARQASGHMVWFNVCLMMFRPQELFDCLLRPAVENTRVTRIEFVLDEAERDNWRNHVAPKLLACEGREKVIEPRWCTLRESVSFILADRASDGRTEAQLSFWGEPFMARATGRDVPRYIFHVQPHSELVSRLVELERGYRISR